MIDYDKELEDNEVDEAIAEQRHTDMMRLLSKISDSISNKNDKGNVELQSLINNNKSLFTDLISKINDFRKPEIPKIELNQEAVIITIDKMGEKIIKGLESLEEKTLNTNKNIKWEFQIIERNSQGFASKIIATPK